MNKTVLSNTNKMNTVLAKNLFKAIEVLNNTPGMTEDDFVRALVSRGICIPEKEPIKEVKAVKKVKRVKKVKKSKIPMPWLGIVNESCCYALRIDGGLFTQCTNNPHHIESEPQSKFHLCKTCCNMVDNHESGKHPYGYVQDRVLNGELWRSPSGKAPVRLITVLNKKNITKEAALEEAARLGLVIPDIEFEERPKRRGRPKLKSAAVSDTDDEEVEVEKQQQIIKKLVKRNDEALKLKKDKAAAKLKAKEDKAAAKLKAKNDKAAAKLKAKKDKAAAKKKAAPAKGEFKTAAQLLRSDGSNMEGLRVMPKDGRKSLLRYMVHRKSGLAVKINAKNYTEEGNARFAELFGSDGRKKVVEEEAEEVVEEVVEEVEEEEVVKEAAVEESNKESNNGSGKLKSVSLDVNEPLSPKKVTEDLEKNQEEIDLSDIELSDLEEEDWEEEEEDAKSFDVSLNCFVDDDTGYFKTITDDFIYNDDGDCVGEMVDGEFVAGEYE